MSITDGVYFNSLDIPNCNELISCSFRAGSVLLFSVFTVNSFVLQPIELWTGKQLFSVLLRPHANMRVYINLTVKEKTYSNKLVRTEGDEEIRIESMCPNDGFVYIRNSELLSGQLGKATLGEFALFFLNQYRNMCMLQLLSYNYVILVIYWINCTLGQVHGFCFLFSADLNFLEVRFYKSFLVK